MKDDSQNNKAEEDKRKHPRKEISAKMSYRELKPSVEEGIIQDVSEGGLCLMLTKGLSPGTVLKVKHELPGEYSLPKEAFVKVIWQKKTHQGFLTGVKFGED
jgi:hypothetical protein